MYVDKYTVCWYLSYNTPYTGNTTSIDIVKEPTRSIQSQENMVRHVKDSNYRQESLSLRDGD